MRLRGRNGCTPHHIQEDELCAVVLHNLCRVSHLARMKQKLFAEHISRGNSVELRQERGVLQRERDGMRKPGCSNGFIEDNRRGRTAPLCGSSAGTHGDSRIEAIYTHQRRTAEAVRLWCPDLSNSAPMDNNKRDPRVCFFEIKW